MSYLVLIPLAISLAIYFVPVLLLHRTRYLRAQDFFVASTPTSPTVFQNASIAYQLQMATFGPFFLWGATGDFLPAIVNSLFFGAGLFLVYRLREPLFGFLAEALGSDTSITLHEFIARQHGNDARVRLAASLLTLFALFGLALGESIGLLTLLKPFMPESRETTYALTLIILMLVFLYSTLAGNSGVMRSDQTHLGIAYLGLFAVGAIVLANLPKMSPSMLSQTALATLLLAVISLTILVYRRASIIDASKIEESPLAPSLKSAASVFRLFEIALNVGIAAVALLVIVLAVVSLRTSYNAIPTGLKAVFFDTKFSCMGFLALALLPLFYGVVDITNWQRMAAIEKGAEAVQNTRSFRRAFFIYAFESPLVWLFMCMFGSVATAAFVPAGEKDVGSFVQHLIELQSGPSLLAVIFLLASAFAMSLSTINSVFAGSLAAIRYDILTAFDAAPAISSLRAESFQRQMRRSAITYGVIFYVVIVAALYLTERFGRLTFGSSQFLALLFAFYCAQLSFVPLILGPIIHRKSSDHLRLTGGWALAVLTCGLIAGMASVGTYLVTEQESWLWGAVPLCLISGFLAFATGLISSRK